MIVEKPLNELWSLAENHSHSESKWIHPLRTQSDLTFLTEQHIYNKMFLSSSPHHRVVLTALSNPGSSMYLTVLPTHKAYQLPDAAVKLACRLRLGLLPFDQLTNTICECCNSTASFNDDPHHLLSCTRMRHLQTKRP
jgi:hypothetical protein